MDKLVRLSGITVPVHKRRGNQKNRDANSKRDFNANQAGVNANQAGVNANQAGVNVTQAGVNVTQAGVNVTQTGVSVNQAGVNVNQASITGSRLLCPKSPNSIGIEFEIADCKVVAWLIEYETHHKLEYVHCSCHMDHCLHIRAVSEFLRGPSIFPMRVTITASTRFKNMNTHMRSFYTWLMLSQSANVVLHIQLWRHFCAEFELAAPCELPEKQEAG